MSPVLPPELDNCVRCVPFARKDGTPASVADTKEEELNVAAVWWSKAAANTANMKR